MGKSVLYVGFDVHKMSVDVAVAEPDPGAEVRFYGRIGGDLEALDKVTRKLPGPNRHLLIARRSF
jgi:transposase